ncbi:MobH family relaxase [Nitrincola iocasae]|nr:MobH family relaxase [Nitrincola iocasae]
MSEAVDLQAKEDGWLLSKSSDELLQDVNRRQLIRQLWDLTSLTHESFELHVEQPIRRLAEIVQLLPASANHHHCYPGGLIDHVLEVAIYALKIRRNRLLPPGGKSEEQSKVAEIWTAAIIYGALLHDIGKIAFDMRVQAIDGTDLCLIHGNIPFGTQYTISYVKGRDYQVHGVSGLLFFTRILTQVNIDWIRSEVDVFNQLVMELSGHHDKSGVIGEIVKKADKASVSKFMGGNPKIAIEQNIVSLQGKLITGLRYIVNNRLKLNEKGASCFVTGDAVWLVSKTVANELRSYLLELGYSSVPSSNPILFDEMQSCGLLQPNLQKKAVWKCKISIDEWSVSLTCVKVHPSVLWPNGDLSDLFKGDVTIEDNQYIESDNSNPQDQVILDSSEELKCEDKNIIKPEVSLHSSSYLDVFDDLDISSANVNYCDGSEEDLNNSISYKNESIDTFEVDVSLGKQFLEWVFSSINSKKLIINDARSFAHTVDDTLFIVSPKAFKRFSLEKYGDDNAWKDIQKSFQRCKVHQKSEDAMNIFKVNVQGPKRSSVIQGYLLRKECNQVSFLYNNPFLELKRD